MHAVQLDGQSETGSDDASSMLIDVDVQPSQSVPSISPPVPTTNGSMALQEKDQLITSLQNDLENARQFITKFRADGQRAIEQYENKISQLEYESQKAHEALEAAQQENVKFKAKAQHLEHERHQHAADSQEAQKQEEKFKKLKELYMKVREEHIETLKKLGALQKEHSDTITNEHAAMTARIDELNELLERAKGARTTGALELMCECSEIHF